MSVGRCGKKKTNKRNKQINIVYDPVPVTDNRIS